MTDLEPYNPVSSMLPIRRDLSVAVGTDYEAKDLGTKYGTRSEPKPTLWKRFPSSVRPPTTSCRQPLGPDWAYPPVNTTWSCG